MRVFVLCLFAGAALVAFAPGAEAYAVQSWCNPVDLVGEDDDIDPNVRVPGGPDGVAGTGLCIVANCISLEWCEDCLVDPRVVPIVLRMLGQ